MFIQLTNQTKKQISYKPSVLRHQVMGIANVFAIGSSIRIGTRVETMVIGQRQAHDDPNDTKLRDDSFAICLSPQMTAN